MKWSAGIAWLWVVQEYYGGAGPHRAVQGYRQRLSISVLCGRQDLMKMTDPAGIGTPAYVAQTGTFSNNPSPPAPPWPVSTCWSAKAPMAPCSPGATG